MYNGGYAANTGLPTAIKVILIIVFIILDLIAICVAGELAEKSGRSKVGWIVLTLLFSYIALVLLGALVGQENAEHKKHHFLEMRRANEKIEKIEKDYNEKIKNLTNQLNELQEQLENQTKK